MQIENHKSEIENSPALPRRDFMRGAAAAAVGGALTKVAIPRVHAAGSDELKIALIGCGGRGTGACVQALSTDGPVKLWAMADAFPDSLEKSHQNLLKGASFSRSEDAGPQTSKMDVPPERRFVGLDAYRKVMALEEIDVVLITGPPGFRPIHFDAAVKAGKHVFMEKPVAVDAPGIRKVLATAAKAKKKNLKVGVGLQRRHSPLYREWIQRVQAGEIGRIITERIYYLGRGVGKYYARSPEDTELEYQIRNWYYFTWLSGDHIVEQQIHQFDVACWMKDQYPVSAQGQGGREVRTGNDYGQIYDHHNVDFTFADGTHLITQCRHIPGCWNHQGEYVDGSKGTGAMISKRAATLRLWEQEQPFWRDTLEENPYQIEHDDLFAAIRNDRPYNEAEYGAKSSMAAILGRMATYSGKVVTWDQAINSDVSLGTDAERFDAPAPIQPGDGDYYPVAIPGSTEV